MMASTLDLTMAPTVELTNTKTALVGYPLSMYPLSRHMFESRYQPLPTVDRDLQRSGDGVIGQQQHKQRGFKSRE